LSRGKKILFPGYLEHAREIPWCPRLFLHQWQGHVVGLAGSKFSLVIISIKKYIKKVSLQGHGVGPGGSLLFVCFLKKIFYQKKNSHEKKNMKKVSLQGHRKLRNCIF
jgi:hypothetical protein